MSMNLITALYLVASVCFIQALKGLSHPTTSRRGNLFGMLGMGLAILTTVGLIYKLGAELAHDGIVYVIVGAMLAAALTVTPLGKTMGTLAVALAAVNVFGGFLVTRRMLEMFKKKAPKAKEEAPK